MACQSGHKNKFRQAYSANTISLFNFCENKNFGISAFEKVYMKELNRTSMEIIRVHRRTVGNF